MARRARATKKLEPFKGTVYILEFSEALGNADNPRGRAKFYVGWTSRKLAVHRVEEHRNGTGAHITRAAVQQGIKLEVVALFPGDKALEKLIKARKDTPTIMRMLRAGKTPKGFPEPFYVAQSWD